MNGIPKERVEFKPEIFPRTINVLKRAEDERLASAVSVGLWTIKNPQKIFLYSGGRTRFDEVGKKIDGNSAFDLASLTKVLVTAPLVALCVERGLLSWETPVQSVLPQFRFSSIQIRHLLAHTSGFEAWGPLWQQLQRGFHPKEISKVPLSVRVARAREHLLALNPVTSPDEKMVYSDYGFLLLGWILEKVTDQRLDHLAKDWIWEHLGLDSLHYVEVDRPASKTESDNYVATEDCPWRGAVLQGQVHDDNTWAMGGIAPHAGVFGNAFDVTAFGVALLQGRLLSQKVRDQMWERVKLPEGCTRTLGWDTPSLGESSSGIYFGSTAVGHLGFTGTSLWVDRNTGLVVTLLTNRVHPSRENPRIREFRPAFHDALREDVKEADLE